MPTFQHPSVLRPVAHLSGRPFDLLELSIGDQVIIAALKTVDLIAVDQAEPLVIKLMRTQRLVEGALFERRIALRAQRAVIAKRNLLVCSRKVRVIKASPLPLDPVAESPV